MIPYQELCDALARWRSKLGLENGPSARVRFQPVTTTVSAPPTIETQPAAFFAPPTVVTAPPAAAVMVPEPAPLPAPGADPATYDGSVDEVFGDLSAGDDSLDAPTNFHIAPKKDETNDLDLDGALVDEDDL